MDVFSSGSPMESVTALAVPSASSHKAPSVDALARDDSVQPPPLSDLLGSRLAEQEADADAGAPDNEEHDLDKPLTDDRTTDGIDMGGPSSLVLPSDIGNDPADVVDDEEIRALAEEFGVAELFDPTADGDNDQDQPLKSAQGSVGGEARDGEFASAEDLANTEDPELSMPFRSADASAVDEISASQAELASKLRSLELEEEAMLREVAASGKPGKPVVAYELSLSELGAMGTATDMSGFEATNSTDLLARLAQEEEELMAQIQQDSYGVDEDCRPVVIAGKEQGIGSGRRLGQRRRVWPQALASAVEWQAGWECSCRSFCFRTT
ncbi:hypothetical protein BCR44DRAFT_1146813 [Catenaria anguillulae PL171]|uniref:Uncharacterized protein n=1 Tax=Catenaria anguillulae PL171 TaxID=765915 RepID=A0A1Y2HIT5_9FUNG|nr:hypothetical protein BCR44DRAFT_1146813 [Catenaria anguillulae PL171]